jgi:glutamate synthase (NADPH/NADH) small chain
MGKPTGFMEYPRRLPKKRPPSERIGDFSEIYLPFCDECLKQQAARCMDCGVPTCHGGCPLGNLIPDWNDLAYRDRWQEAMDSLHQTNNFPEFTGRLCPAPCEEACVLSINSPPVTIELIEKHIVEHAFAAGWIRAMTPPRRTGRKVAVIGSGPAGLACAAQLNRAGHTVTVFEREDRLGGLLRYGIPDFKMEKSILDRRLTLLAEEGILFKTGVEPGRNMAPETLTTFDATVLCLGATRPRDLILPGRQFSGIHFAMDFLTQQNRRLLGDSIEARGLPAISAKGKRVVVIGGGDTGSDCIGTSLRQGAVSVTNLELMPRPPDDRPANQPWPFWPARLHTSASHEEGAKRLFSVQTRRFLGKGGQLRALDIVDVRFEPGPDGPPRAIEVAGSRRRMAADLVLLALGFTGPETGPLVDALGLAMDNRGNLATNDDCMTSVPGMFAAGDARRGQSLIVWAISEGREAARAVDIFLTGRSDLPEKGCCDLPRAP